MTPETIAILLVAATCIICGPGLYVALKSLMTTPRHSFEPTELPQKPSPPPRHKIFGLEQEEFIRRTLEEGNQNDTAARRGSKDDESFLAVNSPRDVFISSNEFATALRESHLPISLDQLEKSLKQAGRSNKSTQKINTNPDRLEGKKYHHACFDELEITNIILNTGASDSDSCSPHRDTSSSSYSSSDYSSSSSDSCSSGD